MVRCHQQDQRQPGKEEKQPAPAEAQRHRRTQSDGAGYHAQRTGEGPARHVLLVAGGVGVHQRRLRANEAHRKRVARDLHDTVLQQLPFIKKAVKQGMLQDPNNATLAALLDDTIQTLRRTIRAQRPPLLDQGLPLALQSLVEEMQNLNGPSPTISWHSNATGRMDLYDEQATALYRIVQEALANALKHADAQNVTVALDVGSDGTTRLSVADDGSGTPRSAPGEWAEEQHYGLTSMRERATMINAELLVVSAPGEGTNVTVEVSSWVRPTGCLTPFPIRPRRGPWSRRA